MSAIDLNNLFSRNFELSRGEIITFDQSAVGDVGCVVWDAALVLCSYIDKIQDEFLGKSVLELGAGTGAAGLVTSATGAKVVITDLPEIVPLMQHNVTLNEKILNGCCTATELTWGNKEHMASIKQDHFSEKVDFLLIADCVYYETIEELVETVVYFSSPSTKVLCSYEDRELGNKAELQSRFFKKCMMSMFEEAMLDHLKILFNRLAEYFHIIEIPLELQDPHYSSPDIHIMQMTLKNK